MALKPGCSIWISANHSVLAGKHGLSTSTVIGDGTQRSQPQSWLGHRGCTTTMPKYSGWRRCCPCCCMRTDWCLILPNCHLPPCFFSLEKILLSRLYFSFWILGLADYTFLSPYMSFSSWTFSHLSGIYFSEIRQGHTAALHWMGLWISQRKPGLRVGDLRCLIYPCKHSHHHLCFAMAMVASSFCSLPTPMAPVLSQQRFIQSSPSSQPQTELFSVQMTFVL